VFWWYEIGLHRNLESSRAVEPSTQSGLRNRRDNPRREGERMSIILILVILLLVFGFGGYRLGPGLGYYGGGGISLIILIVIILLLLKVI
jgi:hypothetical protein